MAVALREASILEPGEGTIIPVPGATMVFKALSSVGVSNFLVGEFTAEPGFAGPRPHVHEAWQEIAGQRIPFSDRTHALDALTKRGAA